MHFCSTSISLKTLTGLHKFECRTNKAHNTGSHYQYYPTSKEIQHHKHSTP
ncbi:hypothetical protein HanPSC8_Chr17g0771781 [Helianthus annuus]|nr:hypothetical protein HanPSC8_Chr17g0771781 [Helianthus annuus]